MSEELQELHEHAEHAREHPALAGATVTMSIIAVLVAAVSVLGHRAHTRTIVDQTEAADSWSEYQARNIRRHSYQLFIDLLSVVDLEDQNRAEQLKAKYGADIKRYEDELKVAQSKATNFTAEAEANERRGARYDLGEVCLEAGLVITSITLITRRKFFWGMGLGLAIAGILVATTGMLMH